jgi:hypothetical protein
MPRKTFVAGEILTAADVNTNLMDQAVMSFAGAAARGSAIPSPTEGMVTYLEDSNFLSVYNGTGWKDALGLAGGIVQVVSTTKTDTFSASVASGGISDEVTGLTAAITPRSSSNKVLVMFSLALSSSGNNKGMEPILLRGGSEIDGARGASEGNRVRVSAGAFSNNLRLATAANFFLDSPNTTSATTYSFKLHNGDSSSNTVYLNRSGTDSNTTEFVRSVSTITLLEVTA